DLATASAVPRKRSAGLADRGITTCRLRPVDANTGPQCRTRCSTRLSGLYWASTRICRMPEFARLAIAKSTMRVDPTKGTAGLHCWSVSGRSRLPSPPARTMATVSRWAVRCRRVVIEPLASVGETLMGGCSGFPVGAGLLSGFPLCNERARAPEQDGAGQAAQQAGDGRQPLVDPKLAAVEQVAPGTHRQRRARDIERRVVPQRGLVRRSTRLQPEAERQPGREHEHDALAARIGEPA